MSKVISISRDELFHHLAISCQIPSYVEGIVTCKILATVATQAGIEVESAELQQAADNFRLTNNLRQAGDTWAWLQKHYLSLDDFEELVYTNALSGKLAQYLFADKVEPWFYQHQLDYAGVVMYEVVLTDEDLAMELFFALTEGEISFHEVARQYIQEPMLRRAGGYQGIVRRTELKPEISAAVFASTPPEILKPIVTSKQVHLISVEEIIQPQLDDELRLKILSDLFSAWLKQQVQQVKIITLFDSEQNIPQTMTSS